MIDFLDIAVLILLCFLGFIAGRAFSGGRKPYAGEVDSLVYPTSSQDYSLTPCLPDITIKLYTAHNGRVLSVESPKARHTNVHSSGPHVPLFSELVLVQEGELLSDAIARVLIIKGLQA